MNIVKQGTEIAYVVPAINCVSVLQQQQQQQKRQNIYRQMGERHFVEGET